MPFGDFIKNKRQLADLTQIELSKKAGVGLRFIRELEQGKETLRLDKVNQVLKLFGHQVGAVPLMINISSLTLAKEEDYQSKDFDRAHEKKKIAKSTCYD